MQVVWMGVPDAYRSGLLNAYTTVDPKLAHL